MLPKPKIPLTVPAPARYAGVAKWQPAALFAVMHYRNKSNQLLSDKTSGTNVGDNESEAKKEYLTWNTSCVKAFEV